jgi:hypothetical protein
LGWFFVYRAIWKRCHGGITRQLLFAIAALTLFGTTNVCAQDVEGFRLGMSFEEVQRLASERSYTMKVTPSVSTADWKSYFLFPDGLYAAFCHDRLSATGKTIDANFHAFANTALKYNESFGEPTTRIHSRLCLDGLP